MLLPDIAQARRFLQTLDPDPTAQFGFRTCDDRGDDPRLAVKAFGTLDRGVRQSADPAKDGNPCCPARLLGFMQSKGAAAFAVVNRLDGRGQRMANAVGVRALFADADSRQQVERLQAFLATTGLTPTALVASGGLHDGTEKQQVYWRVTGCPVPEFRDAQLALVSRIGTDPAVQDPGRVMRLPGFWHLKREPRQTRIVALNDAKYDFRAFVARVKAEPQIVDLGAGRKGRGQAPTARRGTGNSATTNGGPTARLRVLLDRYGGLVTPAVRTLLREAIAPADGRAGNRHETLKTIAARCVQIGWSDLDIRALVLPVVNGEWRDGDWTSHIGSIITWTRGREAAAIAMVRTAPRDLAAAFGAAQNMASVAP